MDFKNRTECAGCNSKEDLKEVLRFGKIPLAGYFPAIQDIYDTNAYDCNLLLCDRCGMLQVDTLVSPEVLFRDYRYMSSIGLSNHFTEVASYLTERFNLKKEDVQVIEFGSNDGVLLKPFDDLGVNAIGFEPSENISQIAISKGCKVINDFFNLESVRKHNFEDSADIVVANNVFAHIDDLDSVAEGVKYCLKNTGSFVFEVHYLLNLVEQNQYDFIYHEHIYYHSIFSLNNFFRKHKMSIYDFELIPVHSGSIRVFVKKGVEEANEKIRMQISREEEAGITNSKGFKNFSRNVETHINSCKKIIKNLIDEKRTMVGFGASGRCNIFCNLLGLGTEQIKFIFDQSPERVNRFIPGVNIPVIEYSKSFESKEFDIVLIFAWNFSNMIMKKIKAKNYLILFPEPKLIEQGYFAEGNL